MKPNIWLLLSYQVPATPSKKRVYVWRKLKEIGAAYFRQGVAILPNNPHNLMIFQVLSDKIKEMEGESTIVEMRFLSRSEDGEMIGNFRKQSRKEYLKIIQDFSHLESIQPNNAQEAKKIQDKARKLKQKLTAIKARDYFRMYGEPEVMGSFKELMKDMSSATDDLKKHIASIFGW